jgi:hypothetical protein
VGAGDDGPRADLEFMRQETRFEIGLLHDRVNALVTAEAFLTIAYTAAMANGTAWGAGFSAVASPVLSLLGLALALLAWPGVRATADLVLTWTQRQADLLAQHPGLVATMPGAAVRGRDDRRAQPDQWRSMLFFRAVPALFTVVWVVLTGLALVLPG